jgi:hypothetical protein
LHCCKGIWLKKSSSKALLFDIWFPVPLALCRISPVLLTDAGMYTCVARSPAGLAELSYNVQVQGIIPLPHWTPHQRFFI